MQAKIILKLENLRKQFGSFTAVDDVNLDIIDGEFLTIVGPSGCGKTTTLRLLAGLDEPTAGNIYLRGNIINHIPANQRPTCMVFQSLAIFPHRTVGENIEFPLKIRGVSSQERRARANELLELLQLPAHYYERNAMQCSGGERQRVALARALAFDPQILFFDEPLSALDYRLRKTLEKELKELHLKTGKTFVYITHSLEEAMVMSDRIAIMKDGGISQLGTANEIYTTPSSRFVAEFMGEVNLFSVTGGENGTFEVSDADIRVGARQSHLGANERATMMVRPEFVRFLQCGETADCVVSGKLHNDFSLGSRMQYEVETADGRILSIERLSEDRFDGGRGSDVLLGWDLENIYFIPEVVDA